jgi:hypothetical protein
MANILAAQGQVLFLVGDSEASGDSFKIEGYEKLTKSLEIRMNLFGKEHKLARTTFELIKHCPFRKPRPKGPQTRPGEQGSEAQKPEKGQKKEGGQGGAGREENSYV